MINYAKKSLILALLAGIGFGATAVQAQERVYVIDQRNVVAKSGFGLCWRTGYWTPAAAAKDPAGCECDKDLLPKEVCERIKEQQPSRVSKEGIFSLSSQEHRTQIGNRKDAFAKLKSIILSAWPRPKIRKIRTGVCVEAKEKNKDNKRMISGKKANRKGVDF